MSAGKQLAVRSTTAADGARAWELVRRAGTLDLNAPYCYLLLCDLFRDSCAAAERDGRLVGFVSAFVRPDRADTLFVWQIAVDPEERGRGIGLTLLRHLAGRAGTGIRYIEATVSPSNSASNRLFARLAAELGAELRTTKEGYPSALFPDGAVHEDEPLLRIGPLGGGADGTSIDKEGFGEQIVSRTDESETVHARI